MKPSITRKLERANKRLQQQLIETENLRDYLWDRVLEQKVAERDEQFSSIMKREIDMVNKVLGIKNG